MKINSLHLENYRCFKNIDIDFDDRLTVLVGLNGAGKTATLDALSFFLSHMGHPFRRTSLLTDMPSSNSSVNSQCEGVTYNIKLTCPDSEVDAPVVLDFLFERQVQNSASLRLNTKAIEKLIPIWGSLAKTINTENPLFVAYMAGRFISENENSVNNVNAVSSTTAAFDKAFNRTIDYPATLVWFNNMDADEARAMRDKGQQYVNPQLAAVRDALSKALLDKYDRPRMMGSPPELIIYEKGTDIIYKVSQLSDGYRSMLALVMDLARRMALTHNSDTLHGKSVLCAPAIVLIDEVELHLHPSWQQTVLTTLMEIFPNTQFIVTTHSPQVLTSVSAKHIRILYEGNAYTVHDQTLGAEASQLLKHIFGVEPRPQNLSIVQELNEYTELVYSEKWDSPRAKDLRKTLAEHFGHDDPKLMELNLHIENSEWERKL